MAHRVHFLIAAMQQSLPLSRPNRADKLDIQGSVLPAQPALGAIPEPANPHDHHGDGCVTLSNYDG
jgi:hypothetical protein